MNKTIVVVDDEKDIRGLIDIILSAQRYTVIPAKSGQELFDVLARIRPDLILLDVMMPGLDGFEVCGRLKQSPATRDIPVVMLTVMADPREVQKGWEAGADAYLTKPFEPQEFEREIRAILGA
ncbi:MAG: response regulator [candidate division FCPU426 bacterium]